MMAAIVSFSHMPSRESKCFEENSRVVNFLVLTWLEIREPWKRSQGRRTDPGFGPEIQDSGPQRG